MHISNEKRLYALSSFLNTVSHIPGIIEDIQISKIKYSPYPLRNTILGIQDLADSIRANGLLQPIVVRPKDANFEIVAGNRRRKACQALHWKKITCHLVDLDDKQAFETSLIENLQRETLAPIEEARAYKAYVTDFGWGGITGLAKKIGKSPSYITRKIQLLNLPIDVINSISGMSLKSSIAGELSTLGDRERQSELASLIIRRHLSLRKARELVNQYKDGTAADPDITVDETIENSRRTFEKLILVLRVALNNVGGLIGMSDENSDWMVKEVLMYHKDMLNQQINLLIKEKRKLNRRLVAINFFGAAKLCQDR
jgi:ParB family transcriptional regulator, chromosome partitioning protein